MSGDWTAGITAVIFDLDGTLIDSTEAIIESTNHTLQLLGKPPFSPDFIRSKIGYRLEDALTGWDDAEKQRLLRLNHDYYQSICLEKTVLLDGVRETLTHLRDRGFRMGVATGKQRDLTLLILDHLRLSPFLEAVVGSDDVKRMKPDPETLREILERLGVSTEEAVYVGDTVLDVRASRNAGMRCIAVLGGTDSLENLRMEEPDRIIRNLREMLEIFPDPPPGPLH